MSRAKLGDLLSDIDSLETETKKSTPVPNLDKLLDEQEVSSPGITDELQELDNGTFIVDFGGNEVVRERETPEVEEEEEFTLEISGLEIEEETDDDEEIEKEKERISEELKQDILEEEPTVKEDSKETLDFLNEFLEEDETAEDETEEDNADSDINITFAEEPVTPPKNNKNLLEEFNKKRQEIEEEFENINAMVKPTEEDSEINITFAEVEEPTTIEEPKITKAVKPPKVKVKPTEETRVAKALDKTMAEIESAISDYSVEKPEVEIDEITVKVLEKLREVPEGSETEIKESLDVTAGIEPKRVTDNLLEEHLPNMNDVVRQGRAGLYVKRKLLKNLVDTGERYILYGNEHGELETKYLSNDIRTKPYHDKLIVYYAEIPTDYNGYRTVYTDFLNELRKGIEEEVVHGRILSLDLKGDLPVNKLTKSEIEEVIEYAEYNGLVIKYDKTKFTMKTYLDLDDTFIEDREDKTGVS